MITVDFFQCNKINKNLRVIWDLIHKKNPNKTSPPPGPQPRVFQEGNENSYNFSYNFYIMSKFPAHGHLKISSDVEKNYSDNFGIEFVVEI